MTFYNEVICKSPLFHSTQQINDLALLEPVTRAAVIAILKDADTIGLDLRVLETFRSKERQAVLFQRHATQLKDVGAHHYGVACDFGLYVNGKYVGDGGAYKFLLPMCKKHGLISGIDWGNPKKKSSFIDAGHVQRVAVKDQTKLFAGLWYPSADYAPILVA